MNEYRPSNRGCRRRRRRRHLSVHAPSSTVRPSVCRPSRLSSVPYTVRLTVRLFVVRPFIPFGGYPNIPNKMKLCGPQHMNKSKN